METLPEQYALIKQTDAALYSVGKKPSIEK